MEELLLLLDQMEQCNLEWYFRCACTRSCLGRLAAKPLL